MFFPHEKIRPTQDEFMQNVTLALKSQKNLLVHAPTGIGKTAAALSPAVEYALNNNKTIFFLTSRNTQHKIAIDTLKEMKDKFKLKLTATSIVGKRNMCSQPGSDLMMSNEFYEYCKGMREDKNCEYYNNTKKGQSPTPYAKIILEQLKEKSPISTEELMKICKENKTKKKLCSYYAAIELAKNSNVIISDYYYIFHPRIRDTFLSSINKELKDIIVIADEGHNLPTRIRDMMSQRLTTIMLVRAIKEAEKFKFQETAQILKTILDILINLSNDLNSISENKLKPQDEKYIKKSDFIKEIEITYDYDQMSADLHFIAEDIREKQKRSYIGSVASFLDAWSGEDDGFVRIINKKRSKRSNQNIIILSYRCLDPSLVTTEIIEQMHSVILMSGTLTPTNMYRELLGFKDTLTIEKQFKSPFPDENRLAMVIPDTTTKYSQRSEDQFKRIAEITAEIANSTPGNSAIFFPSYYLRDQINKYFNPLCKKSTFTENGDMTKRDKEEMLESFKKYEKIGAVLLGCSSGNFAEGIDLPGDLLKCVVVVGLPLQSPDLETKRLIEYYDQKFKKGWDYGYLLPAFTKSLQSAGRCIRSETDKGAIIFLDERYKWP
ncbi:ATP-dependent DNA helicase, partial [Nanoarchaeota archaeon]